ncbi:hypothetical protein EX30DRAFT_212581 [Ascodesmis nigricans]|uniref:Uncharacterized protein n=1 Tax=Ascodesmis nigricans TaxID=341454 RepID=A0A4S2MQY8_9PEZI|nr:hypothetical protein EX30DRAFT_212581 [Ascodesmis nigricans]
MQGWMVSMVVVGTTRVSSRGDLTTERTHGLWSEHQYRRLRNRRLIRKITVVMIGILIGRLHRYVFIGPRY